MDIIPLLQHCVASGASDLHLGEGRVPAVRLHGDIRSLDLPPMSAAEMEAVLRQTMGETAFPAYEQNWEHDFAFEMPSARFRANAFYRADGMAAVFRHIPAAVPTLNDIAAPDIFRQIASAPNGLVLVTGPTGSGKSTTLAAMVDYINQTRPCHILTIEDPIEFVHTGKQALISQREVKRHTHSFAAALRSALREDPDVILIGEMRDAETIRLALTAAETGHLVLATLHTVGAAKTADRIIDVFPAGEKEAVRAMLSESLCAVVSQILLKKRNGRGRVAAHEILLANSAVRNLLRENKTAQLNSVLQTGKAQGMQTLEQSLRQLISDGIIDQNQAAAYL